MNESKNSPSHEKKSSFTPSFIIFRKNQFSDCTSSNNNSVLIVENENQKQSYNIQDTNFFNSGNINNYHD